MKRFADVIDAFGGPLKFSEAVGLRDSHVRTMKARDSIPPEYWSRVAEAAKRAGVDVTTDTLARLAASTAEAGAA